jgi:hypothetical protein
MYEESIRNAIRELEGLKILVKAKDDPLEKDELLDAGLQEIMYNLELVLDDIEYTSDEYSYLSSKIKECE